MKWVEDTIASMTLDEKVRQLFVLLKHSPDMEKAIYNLKTFHQGGVRWQGGDSNAVYAQNKAYQAVRQRLEDAEPYIPMQFKSLYTAMRAGVLADIIDAGEEVRKHLK